MRKRRHCTLAICSFGFDFSAGRVRRVWHRPPEILFLSDPSWTRIQGLRRSQNNKRTQAGGAAFRVAAGIFISRITGLVRERVIAYYFGNSAVADAFRAAIRIPNLLNNLFGEGVLSASFVTVYSKLRAQGEEEANYVARAVLACLPWFVLSWCFSGFC